MIRRACRSVVRLSVALLLLLALLYYLLPDLPWEGWLPPKPRTTVTSSVPVAGEWHTVQRVIDGDTLVLENGERVQLLGVDTPQIKHPKKPDEYFGEEAFAFTRRMVEGKRVRLEFDQANAPSGYRDRYQRVLGYLFLEDGTLLNAELIKQGYGYVSPRDPFTRREEFQRLEREAKETRRGLWAERTDAAEGQSPSS